MNIALRARLIFLPVFVAAAALFGVFVLSVWSGPLARSAQLASLLSPSPLVSSGWLAPLTESKVERENALVPFSFTYYLPIVMDSAFGGWTTGISVRNTTTSTAAIQLTYYDATGRIAGAEAQNLPGRGSWGTYQGGKFGGNWAGSAAIRSDAPLVATANESGPGNYAAGYSAPITPSRTVYLPAIMDNAYGGWSSGVNIQNTADVTATVTISYYSPSGSELKSDSGTIRGNGCWSVFQGGRLGLGFFGSAVVTSDQPIVAVVNEVHPGGSAISYSGFGAGGATVYLPTVLNKAYGGWTTGVSLQNTSAVEATGSIRYYDGAGVLRGTSAITLPARGYRGIYQGEAGLADGFAGSAVISMDRPVAAVVNEVGLSGDAMGYEGVLAPTTEMSLAVIMDNAYGGWNTGIGIQNAESSARNVTVYYYDLNGARLGSYSRSLPGWGYWGLYQGGALGVRAGSARVVSSGPLAVIVNEIGSAGQAISYTGAPSQGGAEGNQNWYLFPANNVWNTRIDTLPVDPRSNDYINSIGPDVGLHPDFGAGTWDGGPIGIPYVVVSGSQAPVFVDFDYADESDPGPYPIPPNPPIEGGPAGHGDRHILIVDRDNLKLYELYAAYPRPNGTWHAGSGAIFDLTSNALRPADWTSADAAGLPMLPGLVRYDEVASGEIRHAIRFTVESTQRKYIWPARHFASSNTDPKLPPMGQRFRLKASFDISPYSPQVQVILRALKTYGMFVADNGSNWYIGGVPDERWDNDTLVQELRAVTGSNFEAVDESSLMVDPNSGQAR